MDDVIGNMMVSKTILLGSSPSPCAKQWKCGRVVYCSGFENHRVETHHEFKSHCFRQIKIKVNILSNVNLYFYSII